MANYAGTSAIFEIRSTATAGNVNGGGFNRNNANFIADFTATSATGNSPVISSVSYSFVAGDVNAWVYVKSGTNWTPGWYQIASVNAGAATVNAAIGQAIQLVNNRFQTNTVAGCATVASPTAGTCGIDYSQQNTAQFSGSDLTGTTTSCTSASTPFTTAMVGNFICLKSGTGVTAGWYEIVSVSGVTATLDRTAGTSYSIVLYKTGGAVSLGGSTTGIDDATFFLQGGTSSSSTSRFFIKGPATYTISASVTVLAGGGTWPVIVEGYNLLRGDLPTIASGNQPTIACGASNLFAPASGNIIRNLTITGTSNNLYATASQSVTSNCKIKNNSSSAGVGAVSMGNNSVLIGCEVISYNGNAITSNANGSAPCVIGCYIHDSFRGISVSANNNMVAINNIIVSCKLVAISDGNTGNSGCVFYSNTLYGAENLLGAGVTAGSNSIVLNNILYGFVNGLNPSANTFTMLSNYNCYFNNTNNIGASSNGAYINANDLTATNPSFTSVSQVTGTTATSSGTTLTDSGKNFTTAGVVAGRDYLQVVSGTGATAGVYGITAVGTTTLTTDNSLGTISANGTYQITIGRNFLPTGSI